MDEKTARHHMRTLGLGPIVKNRNWLNCGCPFAPYSRLHKSAHDNKISFGVNIEAGKRSHFFCFTCHETGSLWELATDLGRLRGKDYSELAKQALMDEVVSITHYDYEADEEDELGEPLDDAIYGDMYPPAWEDRVSRAFLERRRISQRTARLLGLGWDADEERVTFPVRDNNGNLYGYSGRTVLGDEYVNQFYPKVKDYFGLPKRHLLLGEDRARPGFPFLVIEGLIGFARLIEIGAEEVCNPVAVMGSVLTNEKAERLMRWNEPVYLLSDPDPGGDGFLWGRADKNTGAFKGGGAVDLLCNELPTHVPDYPDGVDDVDDLTLDQVKAILDDTPVY